MRFKKIIKLFREGNVSISGLRGRGKDMLIANVVTRRKKPYISNVNYGGEYLPLDPKELSVGGNTHKNFIEGTIKKYVYPYNDDIDIYISDMGVYFPSQFCNELNKDYKELPIFMALSRQIANANVHYNVQNLNRCWDKVREQSDIYILCRRCIYIKWLKLVIQQVTIYDYYDSCLMKRKPLKLPPVPLVAANKKQIRMDREIQMANYEANHGVIKTKWLFYRNKSNYDTRIFKTMLEKGR